MRAAKMMCANKRKKPIAMKKGGNPVAKSLASPALKPKIVKPKKGKGSYNRKAPSVKEMKGGGKTPKSRKVKTPKGTPSFNIAKTFMAKKPVSYSKARAYDTGGDVDKVRSSGKKMLEKIRSRTPKTGEKARARMEAQKKYVEEQNKKAPRTMKSGGKTK